MFNIKNVNTECQCYNAVSRAKYFGGNIKYIGSTHVIDEFIINIFVTCLKKIISIAVVFLSETSSSFSLHM